MATEAVRRLCVLRPWRVFDEGVIIGRTESSDEQTGVIGGKLNTSRIKLPKVVIPLGLHCVDVAKLTLSSYQSPSTKSGYP